MQCVIVHALAAGVWIDFNDLVRNQDGLRSHALCMAVGESDRAVTVMSIGNSVVSVDVMSGTYPETIPTRSIWCSVGAIRKEKELGWESDLTFTEEYGAGRLP